MFWDFFVEVRNLDFCNPSNAKCSFLKIRGTTVQHLFVYALEHFLQELPASISARFGDHVGVKFASLFEKIVSSLEAKNEAEKNGKSANLGQPGVGLAECAGLLGGLGGS